MVFFSCLTGMVEVSYALKDLTRYLIVSRSYELKPGYAVVVPAGVEHNVVNSSDSRDLKLYTIYTPPEHPAGTIHRTKAEADVPEH